jgi:hypothetical protein
MKSGTIFSFTMSRQSKVPSNSNSIEMTYDDPRTGERVRKRGVQDIPAEEVDNVRQRELATLNKPKEQRDLVHRDLTSQNLQLYNRRATQERFPDDNFRRPRRRNSSPSSNASSPSRSRRRRPDRRKGDRDRRTRSEDIRHRLDRDFDTSFDGVIAAAAGAGIGALTARRFGGRDNPYKPQKKSPPWKTVGGAVVGAAAFNAAENWLRVYVDDRVEGRR